MKESGENTIRTGERFNNEDMFQTEQLKSRQALKNIQPKLKVGSPGDRYEQEADVVAEKVMDLDHNLQMHPGENNLVMNRMHPLQNPPIQMKCKECEEEEVLQTKSYGNKVASAESISEQLHSTKGTGISLSEDVNRFMSNAIGADFSQVKLHTGSNAVQMNRQLGARAFTQGNDIYFNSGEYLPESMGGRKLLAHELTHVVQQNGGNGFVQRDLAVEPPNPEAGVMGLLEPEEVSAALHYNLDRFANAAELRLMRDVLGLSPEAEHLIDEEFVQAVASWQAMHNLENIDGKLGVNTVRTLVAEYRGEATYVPEMNTHADRLAIRTRADERASNVDVNGHNDLFDAVLSHRNAQLTLLMRIDFQFHAGATGVAPTADQQRQFIRRFENDVRGVWAEMYALVPDGAQPANYLDTYYANVDIVNTNVNPHYVAHVGSTGGGYVNTDPPGPIAAGGPAAENDQRWLRMGTGDVGMFRGTSRQVDAAGNNRPMSQLTAAHEFGHMLGLPHIHCNTNDANCYGTTDTERSNIMGLGNNVSRTNYAPFLAAMRAITGSNWRVR